MRDFDAFQSSAIRYWELRRIIYNVALTPPALVGYVLSAGLSAGVGDEAQFGLGGILLLFFLSAVGANICFSFVYALEFLFGIDAPESRWSLFWRPLLMVLGTLLAMLLSFFGGANIAIMEYSPPHLSAP